MKKLLSLLLTFISVFLFACKEDKPYISLSTESVNISGEAATYSIDIMSSCSWVAKSSDDWINIKSTHGEMGTHKLSFSVTHSAELDVRVGTIVISNNEYNLKKVLSIHQVQHYISISTESININGDAATHSIDVMSSCSWVALSDNDWIDIQSKNGEAGENKLCFSVTPNKESNIREGCIIIANNEYNLEKVLHIYQAQISNQNSIIYYTTTDSKIIDVGSGRYTFGANIISNTYDDNQGTIVFDAPITTIGSRAFYNCTNLSSMKIPECVTIICTYAFEDCASLTSVTIPDSVKEIDDDAFSECNALKSVFISDLSAWCRISFGFDANPLSYAHNLYLNDEIITELTIPSDITEIKTDSFNSCTSLKKVTIHDNVTEIMTSAFEGCSNLTDIIIGNNVTTIGYAAFEGCSSLTSVTIPDSVTEIRDQVFTGCNSLMEFCGKFASEDGRCLVIDGSLRFFAPANLTEYTIPNNVTTIGYSAFKNCNNLTSITIPNSVTKIDEWAFSGCSSLTSVTIPDSVTTIGKRAFAWCESLASATIPDSVTEIGDAAFNGCRSITDITIPNSIITISEDTFYGCRSLTNVTIPNSVITIDEEAFASCSSLTSVTFGNSVQNVKNKAFTDCTSLTSVHINDLSAWCNISFDYDANPLYYAHNLYINGELMTDLTIPSNITEIKYGAFNKCNCITNVTISDSVTAIGTWAFGYCRNLISAIISDSVTTVGEYAFYYCDSLTDLTIGSSVLKIEKSAFEYCDNLKNIYCKAVTPPTTEEYPFHYVYKQKIYVPMESVEAYKSAQGWSNYASDIVGYNF